jgi:hypothetical protein
MKPSPPPRHADSPSPSKWHYTPKHGSWLDIAESEIGVLAPQCLDRRIAHKQILADEVSAWHDNRQGQPAIQNPPTPASN